MEGQALAVASRIHPAASGRRSGRASLPVPLLASFRNWRIFQVQQEYRYGPEAVTNIGSRLAGVLVLLLACQLVRDARLLVISLVAEAAVAVVLSHLLVPRERVAAVDRSVRREAMRFGLPLMANGLGLAALKQLDQVIVANLFGLASLAEYALALNLAIMPSSILQQIGGRLALPFLLRAGHDAARAARAALIVVLATLAAAAAFAVPVGLLLDRLVPLVYGPHYRPSPAFAALAMLVTFVRFGRGGPNMILLQHGQTGRLTAGNLITGVGLIAGGLLALLWRRREAVLIGLLIGDLLSFLLFTGLLARHLRVGAVLRHGTVLAAAVTLAAAVLWHAGSAGWQARGLALAGSMLLIGLDALVIHRGIVRPFMGHRVPRAVPEMSAPAAHGRSGGGPLSVLPGQTQHPAHAP
jgi:O-antigen/teichoic acid export membrane protein